METANIIFITGGVRSGKSSFAEKISIKTALDVGGNLHYIATAIETDQEMKNRIKKHQKDRRQSGFSWQIWEQSMNIGILAPNFKEKDIILFDCLTTLLTNELLSNSTDEKEIYDRILSGIGEIAHNAHQLVLVSNEVLFDPLNDNKFVHTYCKLLGKLHQKIVELADQAFVVEAGIPLLMKGEKS